MLRFLLDGWTIGVLPGSGAGEADQEKAPVDLATGGTAERLGRARNGGRRRMSSQNLGDPFVLPRSMREKGGQCYVSGEARLTAQFPTHHGGSRAQPYRQRQALCELTAMGGTSSNYPVSPAIERDSLLLYGIGKSLLATARPNSSVISRKLNPGSQDQLSVLYVRAVRGVCSPRHSNQAIRLMSSCSTWRDVRRHAL